MKRFTKYILIFFVIVGAIDIAFGVVARYLNTHAKGGDTKNHFYIAYEMTDSVLIFGSSRAIHHYNPKILEDSLETTVYNCGLDGNGIIYNYGRLLSILSRYQPQTIIYDVISDFDMATDDYSKYLQWQKRLYGDVPGIKEIFQDVNGFEKIKMLSNLYKYNGSIIQMLSDNVKPQQSLSFHGFKPLNGVINYDVASPKKVPVKWDELKLKYFRKFIEDCKQNNINLIISISPWYKAVDSSEYANIIALCQEYNLPLIDMLADPSFSENPQYFADASHLNSVGADIFTTKFAKRLKLLLPN